MKYHEIDTKKGRINFLREKLANDIRWSIKGLLRVYENQTADEQNSGTTKHHNGIGFTGADADILSSFAEQIKKGRQLSEKQCKILFKKMPRYARQLEKAANDAQHEEPIDQSIEGYQAATHGA